MSSSSSRNDWSLKSKGSSEIGNFFKNYGFRCTFPADRLGSRVRIMIERTDDINSNTTPDANEVEELLCFILMKSDSAYLNNDSKKKKEKRSKSDVINDDHNNTIVASDFGIALKKLFGCEGAEKLNCDVLNKDALSKYINHPGITPIYALLENDDSLLMLYEYPKHTLLSLSRFHVNTSLSVPSLWKIEGSGSKDLRLRYIIFQIFQTLAFLHSRGLRAGLLTPEDIVMDDDLWTTLPIAPLVTKEIRKLREKSFRGLTKNNNSNNNDTNFDSSDGTSMIANPIKPPGYDDTLTASWISGRVSNLEYLMALNTAAGRSMIDSLYHPVLPWVTDFSSAEPTFGRGLRDLTQTKFRLSKGDAQLFTSFAHSDPPHHISESLSELTYCIYMARVVPMQVLRRVVRSDFVPEHYPHSVARMYDWTPDECIPEFFCDTNAFQSIHTDRGLKDLELPSFAPTPEAFIKFHRGVLESPEVSSILHIWIDLTFGYCLQGDAARKNMNVPLRHTISAKEKSTARPDLDKHPGFVVLFKEPHPRRKMCPTYIDEVDSDEEEVDDKINEDSIITATTKSSSVSSSGEINDGHKSLMVARTAARRLSAVTPLSLLAFEENMDPHRDLRFTVNTIARPYRSQSHTSRGYRNMRSSSSGGYDRSFMWDNDLSDWVLLEAGTSKGGVGNKRGFNFRGSSSMVGVEHKEISGTGMSKTRSTNKKSVVGLGLGFTGNEAGDYTSQLQHTTFGCEHRFILRHNALLEPKYTRITSSSSSIKVDNDIENTDKDAGSSTTTTNSSNRRIYGTFVDLDEDFNQAISSLCVNSDANTNTKYDIDKDISPFSCSDTNSIVDMDEDVQKEEFVNGAREDLYTVGCVIYELYMGKPLMGVIGGMEESRHFMDLPLVLQRLVKMLCHDSPLVQPSSREVLEMCNTDANEELLAVRRTATNKALGPQLMGYIELCEDVKDQSPVSSSSSPTATSVDYSTAARCHTLNEFCGTLFPSYFYEAYRITGLLRKHTNSFDGLSIATDNAHVLKTIPVEGLGLILPHLLDAISTCTPVDPDAVDLASLTISRTSSVSIVHMNGEGRTSGEHVDVDTTVQQFVEIIDILCSRLGQTYSISVVLPTIISHLQSARNILNLKALIQSDLWRVIIFRMGPPCFLRHFFPSLLTYLIARTFRDLRYASGFRAYSVGSTSMASNASEGDLTSPPLFNLSAQERLNSRESTSTSNDGTTDSVTPRNENSFDASWASEVVDWLARGKTITSGISGLSSNYNTPQKIPKNTKTPGNRKKVSQNRELLLLQSVAGDAIIGLANSALLGPGLCCRYVLPALLALVGCPQQQYQLTHQNTMVNNMHTETAMATSGQDRDKFRNNDPNSNELDRKDLNGDNIDDNDHENDPNPTNDHDNGESRDTDISADRIVSDIQLEKEKISTQYSPTLSGAVSVIVDLGMELGEVPVKEIILRHIFQEALPSIISSFKMDWCNSSASRALLEILFVLSGLAPNLSPAFVGANFLRPLSGSKSSVCIPSLLVQLQLYRGVTGSGNMAGTDMVDSSNVTAPVSSDYHARCQRIRMELIQVLLSTCRWAGARQTYELVLPHVDAFFSSVVEWYSASPGSNNANQGHVNRNSDSPTMNDGNDGNDGNRSGQLIGINTNDSGNTRIMRNGVPSSDFLETMKIGASIFSPLCDLVGEDWFFMKVPSMNPRLQVWLEHVAAGLPLDSDRLPATIQREEASSIQVPSRKPGLLKQAKSMFKSMMKSEKKDKKNSTASRELEAFKSPILDLDELKSSSNNSSPEVNKTIPETTHLHNTIVTKKEEEEEEEGKKKDNDKDENIRTTQFQTPNDNFEQPGRDTMETSESSLNLIYEHRNAILTDRSTPPAIKSSDFTTATTMTTNNKNRVTEKIRDTPSSFHNRLLTRTFTTDTVHARRIRARTASTESVEDYDTDGSRIHGSSGSNGKDILSDGMKHSSEIIHADNQHMSTGVTGQLMAAYNAAVAAASNQQDLVAAPKETSFNEDDGLKMSAIIWNLAGRGRWFGPSDSYLTNRTALDVIKSCIVGGDGKYKISDVNDDEDGDDDRDEHRDRTRTPPDIATTNSSTFSSAAYLSVTYPRVICDTALEASTYSPLSMCTVNSVRLSPTIAPITCLAVNSSESLLLVGSSNDIRIASITSEPISLVSSYNKHSGTPFFASFLKQGNTVLSCDGSLHLWDVETCDVLQHYNPSYNRGLGGNDYGGNYHSSVFNLARNPPAPTKNGASSLPDAFVCVCMVDDGNFDSSSGSVSMGDDLCIAATKDRVFLIDLRSNGQGIDGPMRSVLEWRLPPTGEALQWNNKTATGDAADENFPFISINDNNSTGSGFDYMSKFFDISVANMVQMATGTEASNNSASISMGNSSNININNSKNNTNNTNNNINNVNNNINNNNNNNSSSSGIVLGLGDTSITCVLSVENAVCIGTSAGGLWILEKRTGLTVASCQAHDSAICQLARVTEDRMCVVSNGGKGSIYELPSLVRVSLIKGLPEPSSGITASNAFVQHFEESGGFSYHHRKDTSPSLRPLPVLYSFGGHKGAIGSISTKAIDIQSVTGPEIKLETKYFTDRKGSKLSKKDMQITSSLMLPLRRILLLGTDSGWIRTVI